jgi:hypothetical protein
MIDVAKCRLFPVGADGSATVTAVATDWDKRVEGRVLGIAVDLTTQPNTIDVTIPHPNAPATNLFAKSNLSADTYVSPRLYGVDNAGSALASNVTPDYYYAFGFPLVVLAQGDAGAAKYVDVAIIFER